MAGGRLSFYFDHKTLPDPDVKFAGVGGKLSRRGLMGYKTTAKGKRHWHFAVSARAAVHPAPMMMLRSHVLFSDDGVKLWTSAGLMHRARRSQCKNWWNDDWRDRLLAAMTWLASGASTFDLPLGTSVHGDLNIRPLEFVSPVALNKHARDEKEPEPDDEADDDDDEPEDEP